MAPLCSHISLVEPVPKGRWWLSWMNRRYERNLGSFIQTKHETPIKWMEASQFSSCKESVPYTMCCVGNVHCGIWHWWDSTAPHCTSKTDSKAAYYWTFLQHHLCPALRRKLWHGGTEPHHSSRQCKESHHCCCHGPLVPLVMGNSRTSNILTLRESMQLWSLHQSERTTARDPVLHKKWTYLY